MDFKTRRINNKPEKPKKIPRDPSLPPRFRWNSPMLVSIAIIVLLITGTIKALSSINVGVFLKAAGSDLKTDSYGHTNFLLLGTGGEGHDGADLTDTIIVASLDQEKQTVSMVSIPRDFYVDDDLVGSSRINEVYFNAKNHFESDVRGLNHLKEKIEVMMGLPVHYWVKIDFKGFKELVDALGGIDINLQEGIYDPTYPKDGTYLFEPFSISAGQHHLDGETALKVARSRHTTSDFDRAQRQQNIIYALKEKALSTDIIFSSSKIQAILASLTNNITTNITLDEILTLGAVAADFSKENIKHRLIHDDPTQCGGFLYTPLREAYGGAFVLLPAGGLKMLQIYTDLNFNYQNIDPEKVKIHVLNGTKRGGVAGENKQILQRYCFDIVGFGNAKSKQIPTTTYYYKQKYDENNEPTDSRPPSLDFLQKIIPGKESTQIPQEYIENSYLDKADILIEFGEDYTNSEKYLEDPFYSLPSAAPAAPATPAITPTPAT